MAKRVSSYLLRSNPAPLSVSHCASLGASLSVAMCLSVPLCVSLFVSLCASLCLSVSLCASLCASLGVSLCLCVVTKIHCLEQVHVSLARILSLPEPDSGDVTALDQNKDKELQPEQIRAVEAACDSALAKFGLRGLEFYADALWYAELESADLAQTVYQTRFSLRTAP